MKKIVLTLSLFIFSFLFSFAQKQANIWYFGRFAGLDFSSGSPVPLTNGALYTDEGCATISDKNTGQLLFYTDGDTVWNSNNVVMQNGMGLLGNQSSTQSAVVIPVPGSSTQYYIFTVDAQAGYEPPSTTGFGGVAYSIVDMTMDGGLGAVTSTKNIVLHQKSAEKIAAVRACNGQDLWVVMHDWGTNAFYAYLVTPSGISPPVITNIGIVDSDIGSGINKEAVGYMKFSPDAKKLGVVYYYDLNTLQIFDFDNNTGILSNPITDTHFPANLSGIDGLYGCSFSPDNSKLYVSWFGDGEPNYIYQYNMQAGDSAAIVASQTQIVSQSNVGLGAIQIGPDGKMYIAKLNDLNSDFFSDYLDVINSPNALGTACLYSLNGLYLGGAGVHQSIFGLPDEIESFLIPQYTVSANYTSCSGGSTLTFTDSTLNGTINVLWNFGDPGSGTSDTSSLPNASHTFSTSGSFTVTAYLTNACKTDTFSQTIVTGGNPSAVAGPDTSVCSGAPVQLQASGGTTYIWSPSTALTDTNIANPMAFPTTPITYTVTVSNGGGCSSTKTVTIGVLTSPTPPVIKTSHDTLFCSTDTSYSSYQWFDTSAVIPNATGTFYVASISGNYNVKVTNKNGCSIAVGINVILGVQNYIQKHAVTLSPNPAKDELTISGNFTGEIRLFIYNVLGQIIYSSVESSGTSFNKQIDTREFSNGIYLVKIQQAQEEWAGKFVKN